MPALRSTAATSPVGGRPIRVRTIAIGAARGKTAVGSATAGLDAHAGDSHMHNLREQVGLIIEGVLSGPRGGDVQIAARVATGEVHAVIFLVDPLNAHPHDPDIQAVQRVCNVHNVPLATNLATASLLVTAEKV